MLGLQDARISARGKILDELIISARTVADLSRGLALLKASYFYTLRSVCIFSIMFSIHFLRC